MSGVIGETTVIVLLHVDTVNSIDTEHVRMSPDILMYMSTVIINMLLYHNLIMVTAEDLTDP